MTTRGIIIDLRRGAEAMEATGIRDIPVVRTMRRGADELERLLDEIHMLRAWAEIPEEVA